MRMRFNVRTAGIALVVSGVVGVSGAWAQTPRDRVELSVTAGSPSIDDLKVGGSTLSQGTFTAANPKVTYLVIGNSWTNGAFGSLTLGVRTATDTGGGGPTAYPLNLTLLQAGNPVEQNLQLSAVPYLFNVSGTGAVGSPVVYISLNCSSTVGDPNYCSNADGEELTANLAVDADTNTLNTNIHLQVTLKLVHPSANCLSLYHFLTDQDITEVVTATDVGVVKSGRNAGKVTSTTPYGQFSSNTLVVNTCGSVSDAFDLRIVLDQHFETNPNNNPGNAVFTSVSSLELDPTLFIGSLGSFGARTPQGQQLCLEGIQLDAGHSLWTSVHMGILRGQTLAAPSGTFGGFLAELREMGSCAGTVIDSDSASLTYATK